MNESAVTIVIPTIPTRSAMLTRAVASADAQSYPHVRTEIEVDTERTGAAATRQRGIDRVETEFIAFLDDDDELWPMHLELLVAEQQRTGADVVYPWFDVVGGTDPFPDRFGQQFDEAMLRRRQYVPITVLARTEAIRAAGPLRESVNDKGWTNEDHNLWMDLLGIGATFVHLPQKTWFWHHHSRNTSGNARNW